ncbi:MAG: DUF2334 domain-containing protein [Trueperaceae bacterium]|nr:DUF2334 domain-containing protein [Trueperaceae bacterium]
MTLKWSSLALILAAMLMLGLNGCQSQKTNPDPPNYNEADPDILSPLEAPGERQIVLVLYDDLEPAALKDGGSVKHAPQYFAEEATVGLNVLQGTSYSYTDAAILFAQQIANLVQGTEGHWAEIQPVSQYQAGDAFTVKHTFYIGSTYDSPIPDAFITDIMSGAKVTWLSYNVWALDNANLGTGLDQLGLQFNDVLEAATPARIRSTYNTIEYNNYDFKKQLEPMDIVDMSVDETQVQVYAWARNSGGQRIPYAMKTGNFWYIADNPFIYVYERDRYLVFADLVPLMLGYDISCAPRAIIRVEDVSPNDSATTLATVFNILDEEKVPFGIATIPVYQSQANNIELKWGDNPAALAEMLKAQSGYGQILQHGFTHNYPGLLNPSGDSGNDWEFWNINTDAPISGLTPEIAVQRVKDGRDELLSYGLWPRAWVTPHYAADPSYYSAFKDAYWRFYERRTLKSGNTVTGQFFPYPVRDINNRGLILPENTNFISVGNLLPDILETARANLAMRCPWMGNFFHPFLLDPDYTEVNAVSPAELRQFFADVRALGYTFVSPSSVRRNPIR